MNKKRVIILISGGGSNMEALINAAQCPDYPARIVAVISDNEKALGIEKARASGVPTHLVLRKDFTSKADYEDAMLELLAVYQTDIVCLAGFMKLLSARFIAPYEGKILNIHPSLLPLFPGLNVHERAIAAGVKISGCTVHLVTEGMDEGPIIAQGAVPLCRDDTAETLARRILNVEHQLYPAALKLFIDNNTPESRRDATLISL